MEYYKNITPSFKHVSIIMHAKMARIWFCVTNDFPLLQVKNRLGIIQRQVACMQNNDYICTKLASDNSVEDSVKVQ